MRLFKLIVSRMMTPLLLRAQPLAPGISAMLNVAQKVRCPLQYTLRGALCSVVAWPKAPLVGLVVYAEPYVVQGVQEIHAHLGGDSLSLILNFLILGDP